MRGRYIAGRLAVAAAAIFVAITLNFLLFRAAPGDATNRFANLPNSSPAVQLALKKQFGLDKSLGDQYVAYVRELAHGNLGRSYQDGREVRGVLVTAIGNTIPMALLATTTAILLGASAGLLAAWRRGGWLDNASVLGGLWFLAMPAQFVGIMLIMLTAGYLPSGGMHDPFLQYTSSGTWAEITDYGKHLLLPALTLALSIFGQFVLITRSAMIDTLGEDYVLTARAKGLTTWSTVRRHAARNAMLPVGTLVALSFGGIVGGATLVETVFSWPGIGRAIYEASTNRDYPLLQGAFLVLTFSMVLANLVADLLYVKLDPRVAQ